MFRKIAALAAIAALATACATPMVLTQRQTSLDSALDFVLVVRIEPGRGERQHELFVAIGERSENPARSYLQEEYTYLLRGELEWRIAWQASDRVTLELFERTERGSRPLAELTFVRDPASGDFEQAKPVEESRREVV